MTAGPSTRRVSRRSLIGGAVAGTALAAVGSSIGADEATARSAQRAAGGGRDRRPANMVVFIADQHNFRASSVMGHPLLQTPNLARLAARGTVYESAYCASPICLPSRTSFLTGLPVHRTQVYDNDLSIEPPNFPNVGSVLNGQGLHSTYIGRIDSYRPFDQLGFTEIDARGYRDPEKIYIEQGQPAIIRRASPPPQVNSPDDPPPATGSRTGWPSVATDIDAALDWIATTGRGSDTPWLLVVSVLPPHPPYTATQELLDRYPIDQVHPSPWGRDEPTAQHLYSRDLTYHFGFERYDPVARQLRQGYYASISYVDQQLGRVMDAVTAAGLDDDTVLAYTSDHGDMLGKFGLWQKYVLLEDSARVPMIVAGPGFGPGRRASTPVGHWDLQATIFETMRAGRPAHWLGEPLQRIPLADPGRPAFCENHCQGTRGSSFLVRQGDWKLIWCQRAPHQLFHLASDPEERHDLAAENPGRVRAMTALLRARFADPERESARADERNAAEVRALEEMGATVL